MNTLAQATSWKDFNSHLKEEGVSMEVVMRTKDSRDMKDVQGIRFTKDGLTFKASQLKRGMTFAKMGAKEKEARAEIIMITVSRSNNEDGGLSNWW